MDQYEKVKVEEQIINSKKFSSSVPDIDQLCNLIDEITFGLKSKFQSVPPTQIKTFRSTRLKRLHHKTNLNDNDNLSLLPTTYRTVSMRLSLPSSFLNQFRSLSTYNLPKTRRHSTPNITILHTKSNRPSVNEEDMNSSSNSQSQLSCTIVDTRRSSANLCNVEELAAYLDDFLYLPKSLSGAAELMYT